MESKNCLNCNNELVGKFCSKCGQKSDTHRLDWHYLWHDLPHSILHLDKGIFFTIKELTVRPAATIKEFLAGKRVNHFRPLMYLLITGTLAGLIYSNVHIESAFAKDAETQALIEKYQQYQGKFYNVINLILMPLQALICWFFFRKFINYIEIFTVLCFLIGHMNLLAFLSLIVPFAGGGMLQFSISMLSSVLWFVYMVLVFSQLVKFKASWKNYIYPMIAWLLNYVLITIIVVVAILIYIAMKDNGGAININYGL